MNCCRVILPARAPCATAKAKGDTRSPKAMSACDRIGGNRVKMRIVIPTADSPAGEAEWRNPDNWRRGQKYPSASSG